MGAGSEWIEASEGSDRFGSCKAHNVDFSPQEDCDGTAGAVGEIQSGEEKAA